MTDRKPRSWILSWSVPLTRSLISAKTQPSVDLVFKSSLMNWDCLCIFQNCMTKLCRRESKDTLKDIKQALVLCSRENNPSLIMTITKSRDDSCSSSLRAKLIRKEKRSAISSQFMNSSKTHQQFGATLYKGMESSSFKYNSSAISWIHSGLLFYSSLTKIPSNRDVVISCKERQNKNINLHKPRFHQNTGPSLLNISREWQRQQYAFKDKEDSWFTNSCSPIRQDNKDALSNNQNRCWKCPRPVTLSSTCHSCHQKKAKHIMVDMKSTRAFLHFECNTKS